MKLTVTSTWAAQVRLLVRALGKLAPDQGRVGRLRARRRVVGRLRKIRQEMDAAFPVLSMKPRARARATSNVRRHFGWVPIPLSHETSILRDFTRAGVRTRSFKVTTTDGHARQLWAPTWALQGWLRTPAGKVTLLRKLRTDRKARSIFLVKEALTTDE